MVTVPVTSVSENRYPPMVISASPESVTLTTGSDAIQPGLAMKVPGAVTVMSSAFRWKNG